MLVLLSLILLPLAEFFGVGVKLLLNILIAITEQIANIPFANISVKTPSSIFICMYYLVLFLHIRKNAEKGRTEIQIINKVKNNLKYIITIILIISIILYGIKIANPSTYIYFIDVGQGDSTLIITPQGKTILIDGGGSENYDVGKNILLPYLLDRKVTNLDYVIISHFDTDHVGGILTVLEELNVKKVITGKQYESSENYEKFLRIVKEKNLLVKQVQKGDNINIEKHIQIKVLFPEKEKIEENNINNNSLVFKLMYKDFSILFTGDIERISEERLVKLYSNTNILKSTILKVAHHGSKTSSIQEFLELVHPKIALIGVGKNNLYGHPNQEIIERLKTIGIKIYRTDIDGEITIEVNKRIKIKKMLN